MPNLACRGLSFLVFGALALGCGPTRPAPASVPDRTAEVMGDWRGRGGPFGADQIVRFEKGAWTSRRLGDFGGYTGRWRIEGSTLRMAIVVFDLLPGETNQYSFELSKDGKRLVATSGMGGTLEKEPPKKERRGSSGVSQVPPTR